MIKGYIKRGKFAYQRTAYVFPVPHYYGTDKAIKFTCPVCDMMGNIHQVDESHSNCPICNVNLKWKKKMTKGRDIHSEEKSED